MVPGAASIITDTALYVEIAPAAVNKQYLFKNLFSKPRKDGTPWLEGNRQRIGVSVFAGPACAKSEL